MTPSSFLASKKVLQVSEGGREGVNTAVCHNGVCVGTVVGGSVYPWN